jgi:hypothetical protein
MAYQNVPRDHPCSQVNSSKEQPVVLLEVYDPSGSVEVGAQHAPRLDSLNGKTICELTHLKFESRRTFEAIREQLQKRFPDIKIIPYTEFPILTRTDPGAIISLLKEKGCDGAIVGNAA